MGIWFTIRVDKSALLAERGGVAFEVGQRYRHACFCCAFWRCRAL